MDNAKTAIVYFLPFSKEVIESNDKKESSAEWMIAYVETNQLIENINKHLAEYLNDEGFETSLFPSTSSHEQQAQDRFHSVWSHRHVAHIAGLGKFGLNNMFITEVGCGGRLGSFVTNFVPEEYGTPIDEEYCLYYKNGSCQICVDKCVNDAFVLENGKYKCNREKCAEQIYELNEPPENCDVNESTCGKCMSGVPCSMRRP